MAAFSLFRGTNIAVVTSSENREFSHFEPKGLNSALTSRLPRSQIIELTTAVFRTSCIFWTSCDKENLDRVLKLQKRAARVISDADNQASSVKLFNRLQWLPFYEESK